MSARANILVVDDEPETVELVEFNLRQAGFDVITASDGAQAIRKARMQLPSLILLDLMLPEVDGLEVCKMLRRDASTAAIPILMLTAKAAELDRVLGLELGADDYVTKPFSPRELVLRVKKLLGRGPEPPAKSETMRFGDLVVDVPRHLVSLRGKRIELTATEFSLLTVLAQRLGRVQSRETLLRDVWGYNSLVDTRTVDTHMRRLREKLGPAAKHLDTVRGVGYAGRHVLCEKPMALDAVEAARMLANAERRPTQCAWVDHELRSEPNRRKVRDLIRAGTIGGVRHIELSLKPYRRGDGRAQASAAPWGWWHDAARGGGLLGAVGSHLIDLCRYWSGAEVSAVTGGVATFGPARADETGVVRPVTSDDFASFVMRHANGVMATITLSAVAHHGPGHFAQLTGAEGTLVLTGEVGLELGRPGGPLEDITPPDDLWEKLPVNNMWARSFTRQIRDMVRVIEGAEPEDVPATFRDGWEVQRVMDDIRGRWDPTYGV